MQRPGTMRAAYGALDSMGDTSLLFHSSRGEPNYVRCPRCSTALAAPAGAPTALCGACGQLMMVPLSTMGQGAEVPSPAPSLPPLLVTCQRCKSLLQQPADATVAACGACNNVVTFPPRQSVAPVQQQPQQQQQHSLQGNLGGGILAASGGGAFGSSAWGAPAVSAPSKASDRGPAARSNDDAWTQWPSQQQSSLGLSAGNGGGAIDWQQPAAAPPRPAARRDQVTCPYCRTELRVPPDADKMLCGVCRNVVVAPDA